MVASNKVVREGYKMTELGEIPVAWQVTNLGSLIKIRSGVSPSKVKNITDKGLHPFYKVNDLNFCDKYLCYAIYNFDQMEFKEIPKGAIIFPKRGASIFTNKIAIVDKAGLMDTNLMALEVLDNTATFNEFLYYYLLNRGLMELADTTAVPQINNKHIEPILFSCPPFEEQQKIAEILSTVDEQIENTEQLIEKTKEMKKGLMQQLLTKGIGHTEFKQTELGEIPVEWEVDQFINITEVLKCGVASTPKYVEQGIPFLSSQNVKENRIILDKYNFISKEYHKELTRKVLPRKGDILYTRVGANFGKAAVVNLDFEFSVYVSLTLIRLKENYSEQFYTYLLNSEKYQRMAKNKVFQGGGVPNLNVGEVEKFPMVIPPLEEQQHIASILSSVDEQIESYEQEKEKYLELKKGLMQQLLTGKIRVTV